MSDAGCSSTSFSMRSKKRTKDRNRRLKTLLEDFAKPGLDLSDTSEDVLGDAYIFLIERFASDAGKKAGEFFTPRKVSEVVAKLANPKSGDRICDPACGSGSLLLRAGEEVPTGIFSFSDRSSNGSTRALARLNMLLHKQDAARIDWCDTLNSPTLIESDHLMRFDVVVANPDLARGKSPTLARGDASEVARALPIQPCDVVVAARGTTDVSHSMYFQQTCFHSSIGVHVEKLVFRLGDWLGWEFDIPPIPEQLRIVAVLDAWDRAIERTERLLLAETKRQSKILAFLFWGVTLC